MKWEKTLPENALTIETNEKKTIKNLPVLGRLRVIRLSGKSLYNPRDDCIGKPHDDDTDDHLDDRLASRLDLLFIPTSRHDLETRPKGVKYGNDRYKAEKTFHKIHDSI